MNTTKIEIQRCLKDRFYKGERIKITHHNKVVYDVTRWRDATPEENRFVRKDVIAYDPIYNSLIRELGCFFLEY